MAAEIGTVESIEDQWAWVKTERTSACAHCGSKDNCNLINGGNQMLVKASNAISAEEGDKVEIFLSTKTQLKCIFIVYVVPVFGLLIGAFSGNILANRIDLSQNMGTLLFSVIGFAGAFFLTMIYDKRTQRNRALIPVVRRVVDKFSE